MAVTSRTGMNMIFYIKKVIKNILQNYRPISTETRKTKLLIQNRMQETLDTITGKHQSEAIRNRIILQIVSTIYDIIDVSKSFSNIFRDGFIFSALHNFRYGDKVICLIKA